MTNFLLALQVAFFVLTTVAVYWFWIRPILKTVPRFKEFYTYSGAFWTAVRLKFQGLKGKLAGVLGMAVSTVIYMHDDLLPYVTQVDWTPITQKVPGWVWPIAGFAMFYFIGKCRDWANQRHSATVQAVLANPEQATAILTNPTAPVG